MSVLAARERHNKTHVVSVGLQMGESRAILASRLHVVVGTAIASAIGVRCDAAGQGERADGPKASRTRLAPHTIEDFPRFDGFLAVIGSSS